MEVRIRHGKDKQSEAFARFHGDIHSAGIIIEDGGYIKGSVELSRLPDRA